MNLRSFLLCLTILLTNIVFAQNATYNTRSAFNSVQGSFFSETEDFEDIAGGSPITSLFDGTVTFDGLASNFIGGWIHNCGTQVDGGAIIPEPRFKGNGLAMNFSSPIFAIGADIYDDEGPDQLTLTITTVSGDEFTIADNCTGAGEAGFIGASSSDGIVKAEWNISNTNGNMEIDNITVFKSYTNACNDLELSLDLINNVSCNETNDGSFNFTVSGGSANNLYRFRKINGDGTYTVLSSPTFININNASNAATQISLSNLEEGKYDLYTYCSTDPSVYKAKIFSIEKQACENIGDGLVAYVPFTQNYLDASLYNQTVNFNGYGSLREDRNNIASNALLCGPGAQDGIHILNNEAFNFFNSNGLSITAEIYPQHQGGNYLSIISKWGTGGSEDDEFEFALRDGKLTLYYETGSGYNTLQTDTILSYNQWHNVAFSLDNGTGDLKLFVDGKVKASRIITTKIPSTNENIYVGSNRYFSDTYDFEGKIDEVRIYNRAITNDEVETIRLTNIVENCSNIELTIQESSTKDNLNFTIENGSADNYYRLRKSNGDGSYTVLSNPTFININNDLGITKLINVQNLQDGDYDLYAYCGSDPSYFKGRSFTLHADGSIELRLSFSHDEESEESNGILENKSDNISFSLFPNPASDLIQVSLNGIETEEEATLAIFAVNGQLIHQSNYSSPTINTTIKTNDWPIGVYFVRVSFINSPSINQRIVIY